MAAVDRTETLSAAQSPRSSCMSTHTQVQKVLRQERYHIHYTFYIGRTVAPIVVHVNTHAGAEGPPVRNISYILQVQKVLRHVLFNRSQRYQVHVSVGKSV